MSFKEVLKLRKSGKLDDAYKKAIKDLENDPADLWSKRSIAWVLYDFAKLKTASEDIKSFIKILKEIESLNLPDEEKMIFDSFSWQIGKSLFKLKRGNNVDWQNVTQIFKLVKSFHFSKPSESYSFLYKAFQKKCENWPEYVSFADWWNFENFRSEDFEKENLTDNIPILSLAERAYISYSKAILNNLDFYNKNRIKDLIKSLENIEELYPELLLITYYKVKLLNSIGGNALKEFLPFVFKKSQEFWTWDLLADLQDDEEFKMACYCKALTCFAKDIFLIKIRLKLAKILIQRSLYDEAKTEILKIIKIRKNKGWEIPTNVTQWESSYWFDEAKGNNLNNTFYLKHSYKAEDILFKDKEKQKAVVDNVFKDKMTLHFIVNQDVHGLIYYKKFFSGVSVGEVIDIRIKEKGEQDYYELYSANIVDKDPPQGYISNFENKKVSKNQDQNYAFCKLLELDEITAFIDPNLVNEYNLEDGDIISGKYIRAYNKEKKQFKKKVFKISSLEHVRLEK